ncbi:MAG: condensation domain-containing protein [Candidatus Thorarchaeota archaeon]
MISQDNKSYRREVTGEERRFLFSPNMHTSIVLKLKGSISEEALEKAVNKMLETYPLFGVRLEWNDDDVHWSTTDGAADVPVKLYTRESEDGWMEVLNKEHEIPLSPSKGPLTRFILVNGNDASELIIFCHHSISDGRSLQFALREVFLHLKDPNREPPKGPEVPAQTLEALPEGVKMGKLRSTMIGRFNKKWVEEGRTVFDEEDLQNIWVSFWKNTEYCIETIEFDENETKKLIEVSRKNEVTLNSTLNMTFAKARIEEVGSYDGKALVGSAIDTRKRLRVDCSDAAGYYVGTSLIQFKYKEGSSLSDNVRKYHKEMRKQMESSSIFDTALTYSLLDPTIIDATLLMMLGEQVEPHQSRYKKISEFARKKDGMAQKFRERTEEISPDILSTNLGKLELPEDIPGLQIEQVIFTPGSSLTMEIVLGFATIRGRLTVTLNYYKGFVDGENIRKIRDRAEEILRGLTQE